MVKRLVEIFADGGDGQGIGHLRRTQVLADALRARGTIVRVTPASDEARKILPVSGPSGEAGLRVLDLPYDDPERIRDARRRGIPCVCLDHFGEEAPTITINILERSERPPAGRRLAGLEYAIIRPDVRGLAPAPRGTGVVVVMGGTDLRRAGPDAASWAQSHGQAPVTLVQGPLAAAAAPLGVRAVRNPADLASILASCGWAISNGGTTLMELLHLGKPVHVVPQTPDEERLALRLLAQGAVLGVGQDRLRVPSPEFAAHVGTAARGLVDGKGCDRIIREIEGLL